MRERLADMLHALAGLAMVCAGPGGLRSDDVDAHRSLISQQVADVQGFIESSKFEPGATTPEVIQQLTGDAQTVFLVLLAIARDDGELSGSARGPTPRLATDVAAALEAVAMGLRRGGEIPAIDLDDASAEVERALTAHGPLEGDDDAPGRGSWSSTGSSWSRPSGCCLVIGERLGLDQQQCSVSHFGCARWLSPRLSLTPRDGPQLAAT
jgi:hypothetical protein